MIKGWLSGPRELLDHASEHLKSKTDFDRRIAFISIDNAVELSVVTFLSLPKRISKRIGPSRKEISDACNSFPTYLDLLDKYAGEMKSTIYLEDIEWFHRIRNQLYHDGNCITVDISQVESYFEVGVALFETLFSEKYEPKVIIDYNSLVGNFLNKWNSFDNLFRRKLPEKDTFAYYWKRDFLNNLDASLVEDYNKITNFRNEVVHSCQTYTNKEFEEVFRVLEKLESAIRFLPDNTKNATS